MDTISSESPDETLMSLTKQGKPEAFAILINRHQTPLLNFFRRMGAYRENEDLVQETFIRLFKYVDRYTATAKFTTFLYTIARNTWFDCLRKKQRVEEKEDSLDPEHQDMTDDGGMGRTFLRMDVHQALTQLPEKLRIVVILNIFQGMRYEEISETLAIPVGTVKSRMFHALNKLKEIFEHDNR